jgi:hypothetical protein
MWSGQDSELHNKVIELTCTLLKVKQMFTSSRSSNSLARQERVHRTCNEMLRILVDKTTKDWDTYLPNAVTGFTPFQLRHARHPRFAGVDYDAGGNLDLRRFPKAKEYLVELEYTVTEMMDIVGMLVVEAEAAASASLNAKRKDVKFKLGSFVMLHAPIRTKGAASRLTENSIGPFVVTADNGHKNYTIQHIDAGTTARHGVHNLCASPPELFKGEYHERLVAMRRKDPPPSTSINAKDMLLVTRLSAAYAWQESGRCWMTLPPMCTGGMVCTAGYNPPPVYTLHTSTNL